MHLQPFLYHPYYCEENIYKLCETITGINGYNKELFAVFISNEEKKVPIMSQDLPENTGGTVVWDYHVIAVERDAHSSVIYDLTSILPQPCPIAQYAREGLGPASTWRFSRKFRVVPAALYLEYFASDRTHMLEAGSQIDYQKPPPPHACIVSRNGETMTLPRYLDMTDGAPESADGRYGQIYSETAFMVEFGGVAGNGQA